MKTFAVIIALLFAIETRGAGFRDEYYDPDVQRLIKTECFAFGPVGVGGKICEGEAAFGALVRKKEAIRFIVAAFEQGNDYARCYALIALRESSQAFFRPAMAWLRKHPPGKIKTMSGCIVSELESSSLLDAIEAGKYAVFFKLHEGEKIN